MHAVCMQVKVTTSPKEMTIFLDGLVMMGGELAREIKEEDSTWQIQDGLLEVTMLKKNRRGHYLSGTTNMDTFWYSVWKKAAPAELLGLKVPPVAYYNSRIEPEDIPVDNKRQKSSGKYNKPMIDRSKER
jgi:hypothetical protein